MAGRHCRRTPAVIRAHALLVTWIAPSAPSSAHAGLLARDPPQGLTEAFSLIPPGVATAYTVQPIACTVPANVLRPGDKASFTLQFVNTGQKPLQVDGKVDLVSYGTAEPSVLMLRVFKIADLGSIPIGLDIPPGGLRDVAITPPIPERFGAYALVADLGEHGRALAAGCVRVPRPDPGQIQFPAFSLDECEAPIVGLASSSDPGGRVAFLAAGGHGYVDKPVDHSELAAMIRAHAHQKGDAQRPAILRCGALEVDLAAMEVRRDGEALDLTPTEMKLLIELVANAGQLRTYDDLSRAAWDGGAADHHTIHNHIAHLRAKIEPGRRDRSQIEPVTGMGYRFRTAADRPAEL